MFTFRTFLSKMCKLYNQYHRTSTTTYVVPTFIFYKQHIIIIVNFHVSSSFIVFTKREINLDYYVCVISMTLLSQGGSVLLRWQSAGLKIYSKSKVSS